MESHQGGSDDLCQWHASRAGTYAYDDSNDIIDVLCDWNLWTKLGFPNQTYVTPRSCDFDHSG
eukprot:9334844-Karenia_brevis.AAC.1